MDDSALPGGESPRSDRGSSSSRSAATAASDYAASRSCSPSTKQQEGGHRATALRTARRAAGGTGSRGVGAFQYVAGRGAGSGARLGQLERLLPRRSSTGDLLAPAQERGRGLGEGLLARCGGAGAPPQARRGLGSAAARARPGIARRGAVGPGQPGRGPRLHIELPAGRQRQQRPTAGAAASAQQQSRRSPRPERPASLARRARTVVGDMSKPSEENCYAYCLADRVDVRRLESSWRDDWKKRMRAAAAAAVSAAVARGAALAGGEGEAYAAADEEQGTASRATTMHSQELVVVKLNKDMSLLKVGTKDCFVFAFGCLVCWSCTPQEAEQAKEALAGVLVDSLPSQDVEEDSITIGHLDKRSPTFERLALAYALAQSVRLGALETSVDRSIARTRAIPEHMASTGHVDLSLVQVNKMIGEIFVLKNQVNLYTDILDTPDIFWEYETYEPLYLDCRLELDIEKRVSILNNRFEVLQDMFDVLEGELNERQSNRLEWLVIVLVALCGVLLCIRLSVHLLPDALEPTASTTAAPAAHGSSAVATTSPWTAVTTVASAVVRRR